MVEKKTKTKVKKVKGKKAIERSESNVVGYPDFVLLKNSGALPLGKFSSFVVIECIKTKQIKTAKVLFENLSTFMTYPQNALITHVLGKNPQKIDVKSTIKSAKKIPLTILYVSSEAQDNVEELVVLAKALKKFSTLVICYHKCSRLFSDLLISLADAVFVGNNKSKDHAVALVDFILGRSTPYARVNLNKTAPFDFIPLTEVPTKKFDVYGQGLSFVNFSYANARLSGYTAKIGEKVKCEVDIYNPSAYNQTEVVQFYVTKREEYEPQFMDFKTVEIAQKGKITVVFDLDTQAIHYSCTENYCCQLYVCFGKSSEDVVKIPFKVIF